MKIVILAGGFGTRLGELTRDLPKPMISIGGRPFLARVIESFASRGFEQFVLLVGYRADIIETYFGDGATHGVSIEYCRETEPLGTGGAIREARHLLGDRFLMTFGDVLREYPYDEFVRNHRNALAVYPAKVRGNTGIESGRVIRFDKKVGDLPYVDAGFSVVETEALSLLPPAGACSFEEVIYPELARTGRLDAVVVGHDYLDIGEPEELARARAALEKSPS